MHHCAKRYTELSPQKIAKQRTLELARYGYTNLAVPETVQPKVSRWFRDNRTREDAFATLFLIKALKQEQNIRHSIEFNIHHYARLAQQRLFREELGGACKSMKKVLKVQPEYIHILRRIAAIKALRYNLENGLIQSKHVSSNLEAILSTPRPSEELRVISSFDELLDEFENGNFFPILDTSTGKITFTDCFDKVSKLHDDEDDHCAYRSFNKIAPSSSGLLTKQASARTVTSCSSLLL